MQDLDLGSVLVLGGCISSVLLAIWMSLNERAEVEFSIGGYTYNHFTAYSGGCPVWIVIVIAEADIIVS